MAPALLLAAAAAILLLALRTRERALRAGGIGIALLVAAYGALRAFTAPGAPWRLPGHGPRRWHSPP
jgi:hypothetical protein